MWRVRQKEKELDVGVGVRKRMRGEGHRDRRSQTSDRRYVVEKNDHSLCSTSSRVRCHEYEYRPIEEEGLKDEEIEEFLHSRVKRGRGSVGPRMDETGPYLTSETYHTETISEANFRERWESRVLGPEKPLFLKSSKSSDEELVRYEGEHRKSKTSHSKRVSSSKKHKSKEKLKDKSRKKKGKRSKHRE